MGSLGWGIEKNPRTLHQSNFCLDSLTPCTVIPMAHSDNTEQNIYLSTPHYPSCKYFFPSDQGDYKDGKGKCLQVWNANRKLKNYKIRARINYYTTGEWIAVDTLCLE